MDANSVARLKTVQADAHALRKAIDSLTRSLDALLADQTKDTPEFQPADWKREDGRLNDKGVAAMEMMFESGRSVSEVAKSFDITVSAASHRKRIWQAKSGASA